MVVPGSVQSLVPVARPMKLATARGACFWKNWQVIRPMEVSMTTKGPLGATLIGTLAVGASGRSAGAGGAGGADWANPEEGPMKGATARARAGRKCANLSFMPSLRVNQAAGLMPEGLRKGAFDDQSVFMIPRSQIRDLGHPMRSLYL